MQNKINVEIVKNDESVFFTFHNVKFEVLGDAISHIYIEKKDEDAINRFLNKQLNLLNKLRRKNLLIDVLGYKVRGVETQERYEGKLRDYTFLSVVITLPAKLLKKNLPQAEIILNAN